MPQLYFGFKNQVKPFKETLDTWNSLIKANNIKLIPALAFYKIGREDVYAKSGSNEWIEDDNIISRQIEYSRTKSKYDGFSLFRYDYIFNTSENEKIKISYIVENTTMMNEIPEGCINALTSIYSSLKISKLGLTEEQLQSITPIFEFDLKQTEEKSANGNVFAMMMMSIVLFYAIYFCAYQVSSSITTEKTSKIIETLVTSTSPKTIVLGKTIGIGTVGLAQMILIVAIALISAKTFLEPGLLDSILDMSNITPYLGIMTAIYFILGYLAYALLYALTGSTVSKPEDIQSANSPVAILAVIGFYLSYFTMMNPTSKLNVFASLFPISSPFCMPFRIMMGLANTTDVIMSIAILIATIIAIANIAIKIYSNAILNYGTKMGIKDIIKMYKDKQN